MSSVPHAHDHDHAHGHDHGHDHDHGHHGGGYGGIMRWITTTNHKDIGTLYLWFSFTMFMVGGVMAMAIRLELFSPGLQFFNPDLFNQFTTMHGLIMVFGAIMPAFVGFANWQIPMMIGAPDMAFARLNNWSFWLLPFAALLLMLSFFTPGGAPGVGWTLYAPLTVQMGVGMDLTIFAVHILGMSSILGSINIITTILNMRAPGMTLMRMPLFVWTWLITAYLLVAAMPVLAGAVTMTLTDRHFGTTFFNAAAGGVEERGAEVPVGERHGHRAGQHRHRRHQQVGGDQPGPHEQRHAHQRHAGRAHVEDGGDDVDRAQDRAHAEDVHGEDGEVHADALLHGERGVERPAAARRAAGHEVGEDQQRGGERQQPERPVVEAREGHVGRADHHRDLPVREADERRHDRAEDHDQAVRGDELVVEIGVEVLQPRMEQLQPDEQRHHAADEEHEAGEPQVHRADVLVVGRGDPAHDAAVGAVVAAVAIVGVIVPVGLAVAVDDCAHSMSFICGVL